MFALASLVVLDAWLCFCHGAPSSQGKCNAGMPEQRHGGRKRVEGNANL